MALYLVRHAVAVGRHAWNGSDMDRPLTTKGRRQSEALPRLFKGTDVRRILTSPAARCRETVGPLGKTLGVDVRNLDVLEEGATARKAVDLLHELAEKKGDTVLCGHGDLIPEVLRRLAREGTKLESDLQFAKGSTWELTVGDDGKIVSAHYHPPAE